jgi:hypothetical protein
MLQVNEIWLPVVSFEGSYEVSSLGRVRSLARVIPHSWSGSRTLPSRILSQRLASNGTRHHKRYPTVQIRDAEHNRYTRKVHQLVLEAFVGPRPDNHVACHANDDPTDNRLANLRWDTNSANTQDAVLNGCHPQTRKKVCRQGHAYTAVNTYLRPDGGRGCRACRRVASKKHRISA